MNPIEFIEIAGGITLCLLVITILLSLFRRLQPKIMLRLHKVFGFATLIAALCHFALIMFSGG